MIYQRTMRFSGVILSILVLNMLSPTRCVYGKENAEGQDSMDASDVTWAHAVNSRLDLESALSGAVDYLEADISLGSVVGTSQENVIPIMAHPPLTTSDISLKDWITIVIERATGKGIKLDFKSVDAVPQSLILLKALEEKINFPLWLNGDILPGPGYDGGTPVDPGKLVKLCHEYFPQAVISIGWVTQWLPSNPRESMYYNWRHVREMVDTLRCTGIEPGTNTKMTFPVRAVLAFRSIPQLQWLLQTYPGSSLTVWSAKQDVVSVHDLLKIRSSFAISDIFYDVPEPLNSIFQESKGHPDASLPKDHIFVANNWMLVHQGNANMTCTSECYVKGNTISFGKNVTSMVLLKDSFVIGNGQQFQVQGYVTLLSSKEDQDPLASNSEVFISLTDISLFSKDATTSDDSGVIWNAMNASRIHSFRHRPPKDLCYFFRLDTTKDEIFASWLLPCYNAQDYANDEDLVEGVKQPTSEMRLVLPEGPILLGFAKVGNGYSVIHGLKLNGKAYSSSLAVRGTKHPLNYFTVLSLLAIVLLFI